MGSRAINRPPPPERVPAMIKALLGGALLIIAIIAVIVVGDAVGTGQHALGILLVVLLVAGVASYAWMSESRIRRTSQAVRSELLVSHPVAYACAFEMNSSRSMISSDADHLIVWEVEHGELVEVARMPRSSTQVSRQRVQTAAAKKYEGIQLDSGSPDSGGPLRLSLYTGTFWGLVFPMRGAKLDEAVAALQRGTPAERHGRAAA